MSFHVGEAVCYEGKVWNVDVITRDCIKISRPSADGRHILGTERIIHDPSVLTATSAESPRVAFWRRNGRR